MAIVCPGCGSEVREDATFCDLCHRPLRQEAQPYPPPGQAGYPQYPYRYQTDRQQPDNAQVKLLISTLSLVASGTVIAISSFLPFITVDLGMGIGGNLSGWDIYRLASSLQSNAFYVRLGGISVFSGLCSLLVGIAVAALAAAMLAWRRLEISYAIFPATLIALGISLINVFNIWRLNYDLGLGSILFLLSSIVAIVCGVFVRNSLSG